jgi:16S rRNA (uracil1498-N3)-methyltransferase
MRAAYLENIESQESYDLSGDIAHHLIHVVRIEKNEEILLLDGKGLSVTAKVAEVAKKNLRLTRLAEKQHQRFYQFDLILGIPKKDALELSLKEAVELGFRKIYLVRARFSQIKVPEVERLNSLLISALEQSNSPFLPEVTESSWEEILWNEYGTALLLDSQSGTSDSKRTAAGPTAMIVGPEGGFSPEELTYLRSLPNVESMLLPTPILRTPTAVAAGAGVLLQRLMS